MTTNEIIPNGTQVRFIRRNSLYTGTIIQTGEYRGVRVYRIVDLGGAVYWIREFRVVPMDA